MKNAILATTSITALLGLAACSSSFDLESGKSQILEADKRLFLVKNQTGPFPKPEQPKDRNYLGSHADRLVCAEPSPDAIATQAISAALSADVMGRGGGALGGGYAESAASIAARTAAVQVLRDIEYRACEALMNGVVGPRHYNQILAAAAYTTIGLVGVDGLGRAEMAKAAQISSQAPTTIDTSPRTGTEKPKKDKPSTGADTPATGGGQKSTDATTITVSIADGSPGTSPQNAPSQGSKAQSEGSKAQNESKQEKGWPAAGEMARALCLTTIASPAGVDARLTAAQQIENGNDESPESKTKKPNNELPDYQDTLALTQTCMTGLAPKEEKKAEEPTRPSGPSDVVARK